MGGAEGTEHSDSDEQSSSDEEELTIGDMILALKESEGEQTTEDPMSDEQELSDDGL